MLALVLVVVGCDVVVVIWCGVCFGRGVVVVAVVVVVWFWFACLWLWL